MDYDSSLRMKILHLHGKSVLVCIDRCTVQEDIYIHMHIIGIAVISRQISTCSVKMDVFIADSMHKVSKWHRCVVTFLYIDWLSHK